MRRQLHATEMEHFTIATVTDFKAYMKVQTKILLDGGHQGWTRKSMFDVNFLCEEGAIEHNSLDDHWIYPLEARLRTLAVHLGLVKRLPWEVVMWGENDIIPGLPLAVKIEDSLLVDAANSRDRILKEFSRWPADTFEEMCRIVKNHCQYVKDDDRYIVIEFTHLEHCGQKAEHSIRDEVVACFPTHEDDLANKNIKTTLESLSKIKKSKKTLACSPTLTEDIDTVWKLVYNISQDTSPSEINVSRMSKWYAKIMSLAEIFCSHQTKEKIEGSKKVKDIVVYGRQALNLKWKDFESRDGKEKEMATKMLRTFQWMLTGEQKTAVQHTINEAIAKARAKCLLPASIEDNKSSEDDGTKGDGKIASASSSSSGVVVVEKPATYSSSSVAVVAPAAVSATEKKVQ